MQTILVADDADLNRDLLVQILEEAFRVITAVDGQEVMDLTRREHPDLILTDLSLPVLDGWEMTRQLKADPELCSIPVIALTAHAMAGDEEKARAAGCDEYITKPFNEDILMERIRSALNLQPADDPDDPDDPEDPRR